MMTFKIKLSFTQNTATAPTNHEIGFAVEFYSPLLSWIDRLALRCNPKLFKNVPDDGAPEELPENGDIPPSPAQTVPDEGAPEELPENGDIPPE